MPAGMAFAEGFQTSEDVSEETHQPAVISDEEVAEVLRAFPKSLCRALRSGWSFPLPMTLL